MATRTIPKAASQPVRRQTLPATAETSKGDNISFNLNFVKWLTKNVGFGVKPRKGRSKRVQVALNTIAYCVGYLENNAPRKDRKRAFGEAAQCVLRPMVRQSLRELGGVL